MNLHAPYSMQSNYFEIRKVVLVEDIPVLQDGEIVMQSPLYSSDSVRLVECTRRRMPTASRDIFVLDSFFAKRIEQDAGGP
jgi:hypothetical protein